MHAGINTHSPPLCLSSSPHHVPYVVGQPVNDRVTPADKLQVLGLGGLLRDQEHDKAGRDERHGHDDEDGDHHVGALEPAPTQITEERGRSREESRPCCRMNALGGKTTFLSHGEGGGLQVVQGEAGTGSIHRVVRQRYPCMPKHTDTNTGIISQHTYLFTKVY